MKLKKICIFLFGGTAAMADEGKGAVPNGNYDDLIEKSRSDELAVHIELRPIKNVPSPNLTLCDVVELSEEIRQLNAKDYQGFVVVQGTDTLEECAFALDLLLKLDAPTVLTGAMRNASHIQSDGPANLRAAIQVAASDCARGLGVLAVMGGEVHAACNLAKTNTTAMSAFKSPNTGPLGFVSEDRIVILTHCRHRTRFIEVNSDTHPKNVTLIKLCLGFDKELISSALKLDCHGIVVESFGAGHVPETLVESLAIVARSTPVVLASRIQSGAIMRSTYGYPGAEIDLLSRGLIPAGYLNGLQARIFLMLLLRALG